MFMKPGYLIAALSFVLAGCMQSPEQLYKAGKPLTNQPYKVGGTTASYNRDVTNCEVAAAQKVPAKMITRTTPVYTTPVQTYCNQVGSQVICNSVGGQTYGGDVITTDANANLRKRVYSQCMTDKGWAWITVPVCPKGVTINSLRQSANGGFPVWTKATCYIGTPNGSYIGNP